VAQSVDSGGGVHGAEWSRREGVRREMAFRFTLQGEVIRTALEAHVVGARGRGQKGGVVGNLGWQRFEPSGDKSRQRCDQCQDDAQVHARRNSAMGGGLVA
jgi:hypothetical protein